MRGLNLVLLAPDAERLRGALTLALAHCALGGKAALFLQHEAVALLRDPITAPEDAVHAEKGLPSLEALLGEALDSGITITACQTGLDLASLSAAALPDGIAIGGPVSFLRSVKDGDRLLVL